jgi:Barstar (barnase inhibitor)
MKLDALLRSREPWVHVLLAGESDVCEALRALERSSQGRAVCRVVRGRKATTEPAFFDECAAAWQFPCYFGENWDALEECLTDLEWLPADAYVLCVTRAVHLLEKEPRDQQHRSLLVLYRIAKEWGQSTPSRPAKTFHVLLQGTAAEKPTLEQRLQAAAVPHDVPQ